MTDQFVSILVSWLPIVVFIAAWLYLSRRSQGNLAEFKEYYAEIVATNKEMAATLVQIRELLANGKS